MVHYLHQGRRLTPFTDTTAAAALHVVGQLPYSWFVKLFEINRYILKIFTQKNARFHALIQVDLRSFVRKKETRRWQG